MDKTINLEFDYMERDTVVANVKIYNDGEITCERYTDDFMDNPLPFGNTGESFQRFLRSRVFPETRADKDKILKALGLKHYIPLAIVRKTRGLCYDDFYWVRFRGDTVTYNDIKIRPW